MSQPLAPPLSRHRWSRATLDGSLRARHAISSREDCTRRSPSTYRPGRITFTFPPRFWRRNWVRAQSRCTCPCWKGPWSWRTATAWTARPSATCGWRGWRTSPICPTYPTSICTSTTVLLVRTPLHLSIRARAPTLDFTSSLQASRPSAPPHVLHISTAPPPRLRPPPPRRQRTRHRHHRPPHRS